MTSTCWRAAAIRAPAGITAVALATPAAAIPSWPAGAVTAERAHAARVAAQEEEQEAIMQALRKRSVPQADS